MSSYRCPDCGDLVVEGKGHDIYHCQGRCCQQRDQAEEAQKVAVALATYWKERHDEKAVELEAAQRDAAMGLTRSRNAEAREQARIRERDAARAELKALKAGERVCANERCGKRFVPPPPQQIYCSPKCNNAVCQRKKYQRLKDNAGG
jgi:hypothetical protein